MKRVELVERLMGTLRESGMAPAEQIDSLAEAIKKVRKSMRVTPGLHLKKEFRPLARPSGKMMGKQKREAKSE